MQQPITQQEQMGSQQQQLSQQMSQQLSQQVSQQLSQQVSQQLSQQVQQQLAQQMMLCPVRLVYETQILVQPGEQIQPNQTFFINPNNPPPWMQNRPAPNPVVYVQQLPNNMVQSVQQPVDQSQLYLQQNQINFANYQMQQQMLAQNAQEIRPTMQLASIMPNMVQNVQQTLQQQQTNERTVTSQQVTAQQVQMNNQLVQNQINLANARQVQSQVIQNQNVDAQRQVFMQMRPQMVPQIIQRPVMSLNQPVSQSMPVQPTQQPVTNMPPQQTVTALPNMQMHQQNIGQMYVTNIGQRMPQNMNNVRSQLTNNVVNVQPVVKPRETAPNEANKPNTNTVGSVVPTVRSIPQNYAYRPIQPRPQMNQNMMNVPKSQPIQVQSTPVYNQSNQNIMNISNTQPTNSPYLNSPNTSRKRKSESPDEVQKKIATNAIVKPNYIVPQQSITVTKLSHDIGVNTSPKHVRKNVTPNTPTTSSPQIVKLLENTPQPNETLVINTATNVATTAQIEKDKLIRNTVFTQARGRVLQDKINDPPKPVETITNAAIQTPVSQPHMPSHIPVQHFKDIEQPKGNNVLKMEVPMLGALNKPLEPPKIHSNNTNMSPVHTNTSRNLSMPRLDDFNNMPQTSSKPSYYPQVTSTQTSVTIVPVDTKSNLSMPQLDIKPIEKHNLPQVVPKPEIPNLQPLLRPKPNDNSNKNTNETTPTIVNENLNRKTNENIEVKAKNIDDTNKKQIEDIKPAPVETKVEKIEQTNEVKVPKEEIVEAVSVKVEESERETEGDRVHIKQEKDFILTHVVDGYVIQESNFAFPIRKPLKEKTLQTNAKTEDAPKDLIRESIKEELKSHAVDIPLLPFHYLLLNNDREREEAVQKREEKVEEVENKIDNNPFSKLQQTTVKSWTVDDLSKHLLRHNWKDTVSVLQDHEIDGESLFLVSKPQLVTIGVAEEHADLICEFVKS